LWQELAAQGTGTVPTLVTVVASALASDSVAALALEDTTGATFPWRRYLSRYLVIDWREQFAERSPSQAGMYRTFAPRALRNLREMRAARIPMMPGTDAGVFLIWPGASLHDELALFVSELGMTPTEALASGTRVATGFLGLADSLGIIAVGKVADLVLLEADPLADIRNTRRIRGLVLDGRWYDRSALDRLLEATRAAPDRTVNDWPRRAR
jgi:cytosine/adenosine deaminase-related metal-dependent hydrolase